MGRKAPGNAACPAAYASRLTKSTSRSRRAANKLPQGSELLIWTWAIAQARSAFLEAPARFCAIVGRESRELLTGKQECTFYRRSPILASRWIFGFHPDKGSQRLAGGKYFASASERYATPGNPSKTRARPRRLLRHSRNNRRGRALLDARTYPGVALATLAYPRLIA